MWHAETMSRMMTTENSDAGDPFREALRENVAMLADSLEAIRFECAQVDERAAELFFAGMATLVEAFQALQGADKPGVPQFLLALRKSTRLPLPGR